MLSSLESVFRESSLIGVSDLVLIVFCDGLLYSISVVERIAVAVVVVLTCTFCAGTFSAGTVLLVAGLVCIEGFISDATTGRGKGEVTCASW